MSTPPTVSAVRRSRLHLFLAVTIASLLALMGALTPAQSVEESSSATLATAVAPRNATVYSGDRLVYEVQMSCSEPSLCVNVTLKLTKPLGASGAPSIDAAGGAGVTTWTNPDGSVEVNYATVQAGVLTQFTVSWPTENWRTAPGEQTTEMTVSSENLGQQTKSATIDLIAEANPHINKQSVTSIAVPGQEFAYRIRAEVKGADPAATHGALSLLGTTITDPLPAGVDFVSADNGGTYDPSTRTVTWNRGELKGSVSLGVRVMIPASFSDTEIRNTATIIGTPFGEDDPVSKTSEVVNPAGTSTPEYSVNPVKYGDSVVPGAIHAWAITATNTSNTDVDMEVVDVVPAGFNVLRVSRGVDASAAKPGSTVTFYYTDGANSGPLPFDVPSVPVPVGAPAVEKIVWRIVNVSPTVTAYMRIDSMPDMDILGGQPTVKNCADVSLVGTSIPDKNVCATVSISDVPTPTPKIVKTVTDAAMGPGGIHTWKIALSNATNRASWYPDLYDLQPTNLEYIPGSLLEVAGNDPTCPVASDFTENIVPGYGHGPSLDSPRTLVQWTVSGAAKIENRPDNNPCSYTYQTKVLPGVPAATYGGNSNLENFLGNLIYGFDRDVRLPNGSNAQLKDHRDVHGNNDPDEWAPMSAAVYSVADRADALVTAEVRGDSNAGVWQKSAEVPLQEDQVGKSKPGGTVDFKVSLGTLGNRDITNLVAYDLLPTSGNHGVTDGRYGQDPTGSGNEWTPVMTGPIDIGNAPVTITYSTNPDPCRPEMDNSSLQTSPSTCGGAQDTSWLDAASVTDWSQIRSIRFDFGNTIVPGGEWYDFEWTMDVPTHADNGQPLIGGERTWNRVAISANQATDGRTLLAAEAPWVVAEINTPNDPIPVPTVTPTPTPTPTESETPPPATSTPPAPPTPTLTGDPGPQPSASSDGPPSLAWTGFGGGIAVTIVLLLGGLGIFLVSLQTRRSPR